MRRVVFVEDWFDEDHEIPWNFIKRTGDGGFEAIACHLIDGATSSENEVVETSLGVFGNADAAIKVLRDYVHTEDALVTLRRRCLFASLDFSNLFKD